MGLMDYQARFYSPYLNRFIQPDTITPDPSNPQAWNRFSYVYNNPINANDPSGHKCVGEEGGCFDDDGQVINGAGGWGDSGENEEEGSAESLEDFLKTAENGDVIVAMINDQAMEFVYVEDGDGNIIFWSTNEGLAYYAEQVSAYLIVNEADLSFWELQSDGSYGIMGSTPNFPNPNGGMVSYPYPNITDYYVQVGMQNGANEFGSNLPSGYNNGYLTFDRQYHWYTIGKAVFGFGTTVGGFMTGLPSVTVIGVFSLLFAYEDFISSPQLWDAAGASVNTGLNPIHNYP